MLSAASLPGFAKGDNWAELNQILQHVDKWAKFGNARKNVRASLTEKLRS